MPLTITKTEVDRYPACTYVLVDAVGPRQGVRLYTVNFDRHGKFNHACMTDPNFLFYPAAADVPAEVLRAAQSAYPKEG